MLKLHDILRAGTIQRWHIVNTARQQTLAEHQFNTAILTQAICTRMGVAQDVTMRCTLLALVHDAGECKTGDIPTPAKKLLRKELGPKLDKVLGQFDVEQTDELPRTLKHVLKCADYLDSMLFLQENKVGRHAEFVLADIMASGLAYFESCGDIGAIARDLYYELSNAVYQI